MARTHHFSWVLNGISFALEMNAPGRLLPGLIRTEYGNFYRRRYTAPMLFGVFQNLSDGYSKLFSILYRCDGPELCAGLFFD